MAGISAETNDPHAQDRKQLLHILSEIEEGINEQSIDRMVAQMDEVKQLVWYAVSRTLAGTASSPARCQRAREAGRCVDSLSHHACV